jgi:hypothetical protein
VTSYAKKMSGLAAQWIAANPDPENKFIKPPADVAGSGQDVERLQARLDDARRRYARNGDAALFAKIDAVESDLAKVRESDTRIFAIDGELSKAINAPPGVGAGKGRHGSEFYLELCRWLLAWGRSGRNAFDLSADFVAAMLLTDPDTLDISTARIPFPGVLITIPDGFAVGSEGGHYTKIHAWEVPAAEVAELAIGARIADKIASSPRGTLPEMAERINSTPDSATIGDLCKATGIQDDGSLYRAMICIVATDGAHSLSTFAAIDDLSWSSIDGLPEWSDEANEADQRAQRTIRQVVFGMLAYINAVDGAVTPRPVERKRDRAKGAAPVADVT